VNVNKGIAIGVLTQKHGGQRVTILSKFLDPVTQGWPEHIQVVAATALPTKESRKITFGEKQINSSPHQVRPI
jgi:hypothetical protein